jgi:magnesium transporter
MVLEHFERLEDLELRSAGENLVDQVPIAGPGDRVSDLRQSLLGRQFESAVDIAVCDAGRLAGLIRIEALLAAPGEALASDLMDPSPAVVSSHTDREDAAWHAIQHGESSLAVIDDAGLFLGLVPPRRLLAVLLWEHDQDMARLSGFLQDTSSARLASEEPVVRRFWHRLPWLFVGLIGAMVAASIVEAFQTKLEANLALAFFVPGIVYMADAVGTQTETLVIRGLSVGVPIRAVIRRETITGVLVGAVIAALFFPIGAWYWDGVDLALTVSLSLFAACSTAALVAMTLPSIFHRMNVDPAFGSGPLATVLQDLLSIIIYFGVATAII